MMKPSSRLFDALGNRLREGLRVIEDELRFGQDAPTLLLERVKALRHGTLALERKIKARMGSFRRVSADAGSSLKAPPTSARLSLQDILDASFSRVQESLRSLEEQLKLHIPSLAPKAEALRYEAYSLQEQVWAPRARPWPLYALVTLSLTPHPLERLIHDLVQGGVQAIQLREKNLPDRRLLALALRVKALSEKACRGPRHVSLILNDRPDLAAAAGFDGVHVGQGDLTPRTIKRLFGSRLFVGLSTHSVRQAATARSQGADYIGIGPVFATSTKAHLKFLGLPLMKRMIAASVGVPHVCIGGISVGNATSVFKSGARGVALCTGLIQADNPCRTAKEILSSRFGK